jgi:hypothetical protein
MAIMAHPWPIHGRVEPRLTPATTIARLLVPACCTLHCSNSSCHGYISAWLLLCRLAISSVPSCTSAPLHLYVSALFSCVRSRFNSCALCLRLAPRASCLAVTPNCVTHLPSAKLQPPQPSPPVGIPIHHPKPPIALLGKPPAAALLSLSRAPACSNSAALRNAPVCNRNCNRTRAQPFIRLQPPYLTTLQAPVFPRVTQHHGPLPSTATPRCHCNPLHQRQDMKYGDTLRQRSIPEWGHCESTSTPVAVAMPRPPLTPCACR